MKKTTTTTLTAISGLLLVIGLAWMIFLAVTNSPLAMTAIPAAILCGVATIALAKLDERRNENAGNYSAPTGGAHNRAA